MEWSGRGLIYYITPAYLRDRENLRRDTIKIARLRTELWIQYFPVTKQGCQPLDLGVWSKIKCKFVTVGLEVYFNRS
jgi:hypothetical protein